MKIGIHDTFEREYTAKFREIAARFGEFVMYERDRGARDIGIHLSRPRNDGGELLSPALVWFQLKGIEETTLGKAEFEREEAVPLSLEIRHLRYWYALPAPTYLAVYVESVGTFLVCDIQSVVGELWGDAVYRLTQNTATIHISKNHVLDETAFRQILVENEATAWAARLNADRDRLKLALLHHAVIYRLQTSAQRKVTMRFVIRDWLSKTRIEYHLIERQNDSPWEDVWQQWEFMGFASSLADRFPYLTLAPTDESDSDDEDGSDPDAELHELVLPSGNVVYAENQADELVEFECAVSLNELGQQLGSWLETMVTAGFLEIDLDKGTMVSVAPWHARGV